MLENISAVGGSNLAKAVNYSLNNKKELEAFLLDGRLELTNNRAERAVKPFVMGRKNWLFSDTNKGADASMMWYSVIESAKLNNLNVYGYLLHLLTELPKLGENPAPEQLDSFMPWANITNITVQHHTYFLNAFNRNGFVFTHSSHNIKANPGRFFQFGFIHILINQEFP